MTEAPQQVQVKTVWPVDDSRPLVVNQMAVSAEPSSQPGRFGQGFYISFGHITPPRLIDAAAVESFFREEPELTVDALGTFYLSRSNAEQLHALLGQQLTQAVGPAGTHAS